MKKLVLLLAFVLLSTTCANAFEWKFWEKNSNVQSSTVFESLKGHARTENAEKTEVKDFLQKLGEASNSHNLKDLKIYYSKNFKSMDGFGYDTFFTMIEETFGIYPDITYNTTIKSVDIYGEWATVALFDTVCATVPGSANIDSQEEKGKLEGTCDYILYLRQEGGEWKVIADYIIAEETSLKYGEAYKVNMEFESPLQINNGQEYTLSLKMDCPKDVIALASLNREVITHPAAKPDEVFRKLPQDGILERIVHAQGKGLNEYAIASIGLTRLYLGEGKDTIGFKMSGLALLMKRVNVRL